MIFSKSLRGKFFSHNVRELFYCLHYQVDQSYGRMHKRIVVSHEHDAQECQLRTGGGSQQRTVENTNLRWQCFYMDLN